MSMIGNFLRVPEAELEIYLKNSSALEDKVFNDEEGSSIYDSDNFQDIDKSWEGILFLLTGEGTDTEVSHPLQAFIFSDQLIDPEQELGYGPASYLRPEQVKEMAKLLAAITKEELEKKYDSKAMNEKRIYPGGWDIDEAELKDYLLDYFEDVQNFYAEAAKNDQAVISYIS